LNNAIFVLRLTVSLAIVQGFSDVLPSNVFFLSLNEEMPFLFGVFFLI
jgi:hypothetical protein